MENKKKLVVFYSYTGHTKMIAERIQKEQGCDILELKPKIPYSTDYQTVVDDEQNSEASNHIPQIQDIDVNLSNYEEIILGFPTWWYRPCPVVRAFLVNNNLSGKVIVPFATNAGWLGRSFEEVKKLCPDSKVEKQMNIVFSQDYEENRVITSEKEIENWIKSI